LGGFQYFFAAAEEHLLYRIFVMANRAYLFSSDRDDPEVWSERGDIYYDSRWTIPLAWWFFFRVPDIRLVDMHYDGSTWQEVKFVADKKDALAAFVDRREALMRILGLPDGDEVVSHFFDTVREWPGRYLLMDPEEVFGGGGEPDEGHHKGCARILDAIDARSSAPSEVAEMFSPYSSVEFDNREDFIAQVVGYTYG
jgi:hypothetical protein